MTTGAQPPPPYAAQLPGWLGPIVTVTTQVGVPTVIAGVLLWFVLFRLDTTLTIIEKSEQERVHILAAMQDTLIAALDRQTDKIDAATSTQTAAFIKALDQNMAVNKELASRYWSPQHWSPPPPPHRQPQGGAGTSPPGP